MLIFYDSSNFFLFLLDPCKLFKNYFLLVYHKDCVYTLRSLLVILPILSFFTFVYKALSALKTIFCGFNNIFPKVLKDCVIEHTILLFSFNVLHNYFYPEILATIAFVCKQYMWFKFNKNVGRFAQQCIPCQRLKIY